MARSTLKICPLLGIAAEVPQNVKNTSTDEEMNMREPESPGDIRKDPSFEIITQ